MTPLKMRRKRGYALREFIQDYFLSYSDFARFVDYSPSTVSGWMSGRSPVPESVIERLERSFPIDALKQLR
jgi:transcriptional regulator with XRE-family HTH domain